MATNKMTHRIEDDKILILEREFNAPRKLVFEMFKKPEHIKHFWGPRGWDVPVCKVDFKPGGSWTYCMKCVDKNQGEYFGMEAWGRADYKEIVEPEKLVYIDSFLDADQKVDMKLPAGLITNTFVEMGNKTKLISHGDYGSADNLKVLMNMGVIQGISETYDRLEEYLATQM